MGSDSDASVMQRSVDVLAELGVTSHMTVASAHRSPDRVKRIIDESLGNGVQVFIVGAGAAAHLAGVVAAHSTLPVIGVPIQSRVLNGVDSLLSIVQMPAGVPVMTMSIGAAGAKNAALSAASILALKDAAVASQLAEFRQQQTDQVLNNPNPGSAE